MKIKIKVRTIIKLTILALFIFIVVIPFGTLQIANFLDSRGNDKAKVFYESYLAKTVKFQDAQALYNYANNLVGYPSRYTIMMQGSGGSGDRSTLEDLNKAKLALEEIIKKGQGDYFDLAYKKLMDISIITQNPKELEEWIDWGQNNDDSKIKYISDLYNSYYHFVNRDYEKANEILNIYEEEQISDYGYYFLKGYIALFQGDINKAKSYFDERNYVGANKYDDTLFGTASHQSRDFLLEDYMKDQIGEFKVRGHVTFNGKPMPFVEVYIQENFAGYRSSGEEFIGITDINGEFETIGFREGRYDIGIGLSNSMLYDKIFLSKDKRFIDIDKDLNYDFAFSSPIKVTDPRPGTLIKDDEFKVQWDVVEGVDYYDIQTIVFENHDENSGSSARFSILYNSSNRELLKDNEIVLNLNELRKSTGGFMWSGDEMIVQPSAILGTFIKGYKYPLVINAYDEDKNLIGSSLPINSYYDKMPSIEVEGELNEGEKLISNKEYEEAIEYYTDILENDPNNEEALIYLSKIYYIGYKKDMEDYNKALEYAIRYDEIKDDTSLINNAIGFMDHEAHRRHKEYVSDFFENVDDEKRDEHYYFDKGKFYLSTRDYEKARETLEKTSFVRTNLFFIDLYLGELDSALSRLEEGIDLYRMNKITLRESILGLYQDDNLSEDYRYLKELLDYILSHDDVYDEGLSFYNKIITKVKNKNIRAIFNEIKMYMNWDRYVEELVP